MIKYIDLFCGMGAFRYSMNKLESKCVFSSEIKQAAIENYSFNYNEMPTGDITLVKSEDIPSHDLLLAGFPCQPFSSAGKGLGFADTRGTLFFEIERILEYHKPKYFILENVIGLKNYVIFSLNSSLTFSFLIILNVSHTLKNIF